MHWPTRRPRTRWLLCGVAVTGLVIAAVAITLRVVNVMPGATSAHVAAPMKTPVPQQAAAPGSAAEYRFLSTQTSNACGLLPSTVMSYGDAVRIQGSCCSPMEMAKYSMQVQGLRQYAAIARIPSDPYDVPASQAKQLLADDETIHLSSAQQAVYDQAMTMTDDKGPCCCHCWRWNATEGLGRYLIAEQRWSAPDVARVVDLVNGCGGPA